MINFLERVVLAICWFRLGSSTLRGLPWWLSIAFTHDYRCALLLTLKAGQSMQCRT